MDSVSQKNEAYVSDSVLMLSLLGDIEDRATTIESYINQYNNGIITDSSIIFNAFNEIYDEKMKLDDIVSSINMHGWKVIYNESDMQDFNYATRKHCFISNCTIKRSFPIDELVPPFSINITNLGLGAIDSGDEVTIRIYNESINQSSILTVPVKTTLSEIMSSQNIVVDTLKCPGIPYEYSLEISIKNKETNNVFGSVRIDGINILSLSGLEAE